jgi:hypothetical protein
MDETDPATQDPREAHPLSGVLAFWEAVTDDMEATAEEYREAGWDVLTLHPGDVTALPATYADGTEGDEFGLDVLVPGDEFRELESLVAEAAFDSYEAYRALQNDTVFLVVVMQAESAGQAVVFPVYYATSEADRMIELAREAGEMHTFVRPLSNDRRVEFTQRDPASLLPPSGGE